METELDLATQKEIKYMETIIKRVTCVIGAYIKEMQNDKMPIERVFPVIMATLVNISASMVINFLKGNENNQQIKESVTFGRAVKNLIKKSINDEKQKSTLQ